MIYSLKLVAGIKNLVDYPFKIVQPFPFSEKS